MRSKVPGGPAEGDKLVFAGKVERGFTDDASKDLRKRLLPLRTTC